jgi:hypothetical protein
MAYEDCGEGEMKIFIVWEEYNDDVNHVHTLESVFSSELSAITATSGLASQNTDDRVEFYYSEEGVFE